MEGLGREGRGWWGGQDSAMTCVGVYGGGGGCSLDKLEIDCPGERMVCVCVYDASGCTLTVHPSDAEAAVVAETAAAAGTTDTVAAGETAADIKEGQ